MRYARFGFGAVLVGVLAVSAAGQDAVTLKVAKPKDGDRVRTTKTEKTKSAVTFTAGGNTQSKDDTETRLIVYVDEVVTADPKGGRPTKARRTYEKYDVTKGGKAEAGPPLNTAILIEKKGDKYEFTADGKPLDAAFAKKLSNEFDKSDLDPRNEDLLPTKPVKPGDTWKVDGAKIGKAVGQGELVIDTDASSLTGKLVKTYQKDGKLFGVMEYTGDIVIKGLGEKTPLQVKPGSKMGLKMAVVACVDGTDLASQTAGELTAKLDAEGKGVTLSLVADGKVTSTTEPLPKK